MKNQEKGKFEDAWQKAFDDAEQAPSESVWLGVEQSLNKTATVVMKRRVVFYQRLAAASVFFALLLGGLSTYYISDSGSEKALGLTEKNPSTNQSNEVKTNPTQVDKGKIVAESDVENNDVKDSKENVSDIPSVNSVAFVPGNLDRSIASEETKKDLFQQEKGKQFVSRNYPSLLTTIPALTIELEGSMRDVTIARNLPAMPAVFMDSKKDKKSKENLWASLGASTGNYSPAMGLGTVSAADAIIQNSGSAFTRQPATSKTESKGTVFSVNMNMGKRVSKKWIVQGGVSYLNQAIGYTSNFAALDANNNAMATVVEYADSKTFSSVVAATPYEVNSTNQLISVPMQAGYLLVDKKFGLQLNSGIATDFFLQNTLTDKSGQLDSYSSTANSDSPYRAVTWAGLVGSEVSYKIATQYRISIVPGLRYSINSVLKSNSSPANPLAWDVGFRFRYIFK
jgi:hypothetical protein